MNSKTTPRRGKRTLPRIVRHDADFLADQIDAVATLMWALAERMEYYAGFSGKMNKHAREMAGASAIARGWAKAIRPMPNTQAEGRASRTLPRMVGGTIGDKP